MYNCIILYIHIYILFNIYSTYQNDTLNIPTSKLLNIHTSWYCSQLFGTFVLTSSILALEALQKLVQSKKGKLPILNEASSCGPDRWSDSAIYHLVMTNIAMENPNHIWRFIIVGKIIYFNGLWLPWRTVSHNQRVPCLFVFWIFLNQEIWRRRK